MRIAGLGALVILAGCVAFGGERRTWGEFGGDSALALAAEQLAFGPRIPGTPAHAQTGDFILNHLAQNGWATAEQRFAYRGVELRNLVGTAGSSERGAYILFGAHYDTRPRADEDQTSPSAPVPGANDGAAGVAVLLELARAIPTGALECRVDLVFFDAEDSGGLEGWDWIVGSSHFAANLSELPDAVVIPDLVGDADLQLFYEHNSDQQLREEIWQTAAILGHPGFIPEPKYSVLDDHTPFLEMGIPAVDLIDFDYPFWHTTEDTLDKISADSLHQVGATLLSWLRSRCA